MRIAILEDDPSQLELFSHWLTLAGHQLLPFERGEEFLSAIRREQFEMLVLDWNLHPVDVEAQRFPVVGHRKVDNFVAASGAVASASQKLPPTAGAPPWVEVASRQ